jgi:lipoprotein NlpD
MTIIATKSSTSTLMVISILIALSSLSACSSHRTTNISEHSTQAVYKGKTHTVTRGETLFSIAWRYGLDLNKLASFNGIKPPFTIFPSQKIRLDIRGGSAAPLNATSVTKNRKNDDLDPSLAGSIIRSKNRPNGEKNLPKAQIFYSPLKWQWPAAGQPVALFQGNLGINKGIDIRGNMGEPVLAAASGRVVYAGSGLSGYGNLLIIKHSEIFLSAYAHNNALLVKEGDFIKGGQHIADMGSSGTDRVKLHFEIRSEGSPVDPLRYLPKR